MLEHCKNANERWGGVSKILDTWLQQRQELIVEFCTVSGVHALASAAGKNKQHNVQHFCELMVDYVSAGHFEVYDHLIQEAEEFDDGSALDAAKLLYPKISATTERVLSFNDNLEAMLNTEQNAPTLARELSLIGETLVSRFELEDQLVEKLHYSHKEHVVGI